MTRELVQANRRESGLATIRRAALGLGIALAFVFALPHPANAGASGTHKFEYDPSTCKTDAQGKLYIALGRNVLALPTSGTAIVARYGSNWLTPPDPTEPIGCPNNPEQLTGYGFPYAFNAAAGNRNSPFPRERVAVDLLQLISFHGRGGVAAGDDREWGGESYQAGIARIVCEKATISEDLPSGLRVCRDGAKASSLQVEDWRATYIADPDVYKTPLGRPFIVNCGPFTYSTAIGDCDVAYVMRPGMGVTYRFHPYHGSPTPLPIDQVIEFDRGLRAAISKSLAKSYVWPAQESVAHGPEEKGRP